MPESRAEARLMSPLAVADEVWIVTALLHREHPEREDFTAKEIEARARREAICAPLRPGVYVHAILHCVANREPKPARLCMLYATGRSRRRLYRPGDACDPGRASGRTVPDLADVPAAYRFLLEWYASEYVPRGAGEPRRDPLLAARGLGRDLRSDEHPDTHVAGLRAGWT